MKSDAVCWLDVVTDDDVCCGEGKGKEGKKGKKRTKRSRVQVSYPALSSSHTKLSLRIASLALSQSKALPQSIDKLTL